MRKDEDRFSERLTVKCPSRLPALVDQAASRQLTSRSDYVRTALLDRLRADGVDLHGSDEKPLAEDAPIGGVLGSVR